MPSYTSLLSTSNPQPINWGSYSMGTKAASPSLATPTMTNTLASQFKAPSTQQQSTLPLSFSLGGNYGSIIPSSTNMTSTPTTTGQGTLGMLGSTLGTGLSYLGNLNNINTAGTYNAPSVPSAPSIQNTLGAYSQPQPPQQSAPASTQYNTQYSGNTSPPPANPNYNLQVPPAMSGAGGIGSQTQPSAPTAPTTPSSPSTPTSPNTGTASGVYQQLLQQIGAYGSLLNNALSQYSNNPQEIATLRQNLQTALGDEAQYDPSNIEFKTGTQAQLIGQEAAKEAALQAPLTALAPFAQTQAGLMGTAEQLATTLPQSPYGVPLYSPTTGQFVTPGGAGTGTQIGGTSGLDPNTWAQNLAPLVANGQMDFNTALNQAPGGASNFAYQTALRNAITSVNPNFNFNLSQSSAQTQAQGQQAGSLVPAANTALDAVQQSFAALPGLEQTSIPILNQLTQGLSVMAGPGRTATSNFYSALQEARARIEAVLSPTIGVNAATNQANALLPDNMVPNEVPQRISYAKTYLQNFTSSLVQSGQQSNIPSSPQELPGGSNSYAQSSNPTGWF